MVRSTQESDAGLYTTARELLSADLNLLCLFLYYVLYMYGYLRFFFACLCAEYTFIPIPAHAVVGGGLTAQWKHSPHCYAPTPPSLYFLEAKRSVTVQQYSMYS